MPSIKQIGTICFALSFIIFPKFTFADNEPTVIPTPANCNEAVLNTTEGSADLEAIYTANTINTTWYSGYGNNASVANATQCSYDGTINLPQTNPSRPGYAFNGWKLKACSVPINNVMIHPQHMYAKDASSMCSKDVSSGEQHNTTIGDDEYFFYSGDICSESSFADLSIKEWKAEFSYGTVKGIASCQPTLPAYVDYAVTNINAVMGGQMDTNQFISGYTALAGQEKGAIAQQAFQAYANGDTDTAYALFYGQVAAVPGDTNYQTTDIGGNCWCKITSYTASGTQSCNVVSNAWILASWGGSDNRCEDCAENCTHNMLYPEIRAAFFNSTLQ